jgi:hypothetical protein
MTRICMINFIVSTIFLNRINNIIENRLS